MMEEVIKFAVRAAAAGETMWRLCEDFGISRKTGYKWLRRYQADGVGGLRPRCRRPRGCKHGR